MNNTQAQVLITTDRLHLSLLEAQPDAAFIYELLNSPGWKTFIGDRKVHSVEEAQNYISTRLASSYLKHGFGLYKVALKDGTPLGICGLLKRDHLLNVDIGYAMLPQHEGQGYTYEAAQATLKYAKDTLGFEVVLGITDTENTASQKLLEKLGFRFVKSGFLEDFEGESMVYEIRLT
ncbi:N-acetyltransferase [Fulvivirga sp. RKSG066]|uniref:GNAT family N-acetyltransferase n=1 Tax=Fulvivirga aurantia TaxID=2529383 RepID=UPI00162760B2|nr:N-acetyltransferase [Fulvivirga aurantia]